jgi:epoxyqueuosine reductase QueG
MLGRTSSARRKHFIIHDVESFNDMNGLREELEKYSRSMGIDLFGVADLTDNMTHKNLLRQGGAHISRYPKAVSLGIRLLDPIVNQLQQHEEPSAIYSYRGLYNQANANLDRSAMLIAKKIQEAGYETYPIPASQTINNRKMEGAISHKLSANLAGLGWIGKSCLLITPEYGPRVRLATILTDAPLETGEPLLNRCDDCHDCVDVCPPKAFTGVAFDPSEPRGVRFRANLCSDYSQTRAKQLGEGICGLCVYICPHGLKKQ